MFVRNLVKHGAKAIGVEFRHYGLFRRAVHILVKNGSDPFFLQIGANNGVDFDDFFEIVSQYDLPGIVVEPIPYYFEALSQAYKRHTQVIPVNCAIHPTDNGATIYRADPARLTIGWQHGLGSFSRDHLIKYGVAEDAVLEESVKCMTLNAIVEKYLPEHRQVDILVSDTEGFDAEIIGMVDFNQISPKVLKFESKHLSISARTEIEAKLTENKFHIEKGVEDWVAVKANLASRLGYLSAAMR